MASSNRLCVGGEAAEPATNFAVGRMRRMWEAKEKKRSVSRARSSKTTSGTIAAESGTTLPGITHSCIDSTRPVCCAAAASCAELVVSLVTIPTVSIACSYLNLSGLKFCMSIGASLCVWLYILRRRRRRGQKRFWETQLRSGLARRNRMHDVRCGHNHQFIVGFVQCPALKELAQNRNVADAWYF